MSNLPSGTLQYYRGDERPLAPPRGKVDPVTTEIVRRALNSAAVQMSRATSRTAFSPAVYEGKDFAVVLYDRQIRMLAQAPTIPLFMGTMSFCIEAAVAAVGGEGGLQPGDVIVYNKPYGTGSHAQDCAIVMPVFDAEGALVGYSANKAHWADIGAKSFYCSDTTDVFQEGVVIPGVKVYRAGQLNEDVYRMILANSRAPEELAGDLNAQIASCHVGAREMLRVRQRFGAEAFEQAVEAMIAHAEKLVRDMIESIPDGIYEATCHMDNNGLDDVSISFPLSVQVEGRAVTIDLSRAPDAQAGPTNCPLPSTVSGARVALAMLVGGAGSTNEIPNEGHFRPLSIVTRVGSMFHPVEPQPCFLYGWPIMSAMEGIYEALAKALPGLVPSGSAADICGVLFYGRDKGGELFAIACPMPVGQGASPKGDGATLFVPGLAQSSLAECEIQEAKAPVIFEKWEFTPDSGGPGEFRGGLGWEFHYRLLEDVMIISVIERTKVPGWAQAGGKPGGTNRFTIEYPDGRVQEYRKVTDLPVPAGSRIRVWCGGGGGFGPPERRPKEKLLEDLKAGVVTQEAAETIYMHAQA